MTSARSGADSDLLLQQARSGDAESRGLLLDRYRNYLNFLARGLIGGPLRVNLDASDLVQQTFLEAHRDLAQFEGTGEPALAAWLRRILIHNLAQQAEYHGSTEARAEAAGLTGCPARTIRSVRGLRPRPADDHAQ